MESAISSLDLYVIGIYFVAALLIGLLVARTTKTGEDLFLGDWPLNFTYNMGIMSGVSALIFIGISLATAAPDPKQIEQYTYKKELITADTAGLPWYKNHLNWIGVLVISIGLLVHIFW